MDLYVHPSKGKKKSGAQFFSKTGNKIKTYSVDIKGKKSKPSYTKYKGTAKQYYRLYISYLKKQGILNK